MTSWPTPSLTHSDRQMSGVIDPAVKLFVADLPHIQPASASASASAPALPFAYRGRAFGRVWVQGVVTHVSSPPHAHQPPFLLLDDGTGVARLDLRPIVQNQTLGTRGLEGVGVGEHVMAVGVPLLPSTRPSTITAHQCVRLSHGPLRETLWIAEVVASWSVPPAGAAGGAGVGKASASSSLAASSGNGKGVGEESLAW